MQPVLTHVPPKRLRSTIAVLRPACARRTASGGPAWPVPITIASKDSIIWLPSLFLERVLSTTERSRAERGASGTGRKSPPASPVLKRFGLGAAPQVLLQELRRRNRHAHRQER